MSTKASILVVDDTPANLRLLVNILSENGYKARPTTNGRTALRAARNTKPDLILLDINMPEMDGYAVCEALKSDETLRDVPVIFVSALDEVMDKVRAFRVGGADYVTKPFEFTEVLARIETHLTLARQRREIEERRTREARYEDRLDETKSSFNRSALPPLSQIDEFASAIEQAGAAGNPQVRTYLDHIRRSTKDVVTLVDEMLDVVRVEAGLGLELQPLDLGAFVEKTVDPESLPDHTLTVSVEANELLLIDADEGKLAAMLGQLLDNAQKFTPPGGTITVRVVHLGFEHVMLYVTDTGPGIPPEAHPYIFDKFYRGPGVEDLPGRGLGLSIVEAISEQHNAELDFASEPGKGTTFSVRFARRLTE